MIATRRARAPISSRALLPSKTFGERGSCLMKRFEIIRCVMCRERPWFWDGNHFFCSYQHQSEFYVEVI